MEHNPVVSLFLALGLIILASRVAGTLARRLHQPRVLGELIIGVLLGPTFFNLLQRDIFHGVELEVTIKELAELGVLILMFIVGLEVHLSELAKVGRVAMFAGVLGVAVPVLLTMPVVLLDGYSWEPALFAGVTLAATSVSISAQVLLELGYLRTKEGNALLATALIDDVLAILLVSLAIAVTGSSESSEGGAGELLVIILKMGGFIVISGLLAWYVLPPIMNWISNRPDTSQAYGVPAIALVIMLIFGWGAEELGGVATITGSFIAGVGLSRVREQAKHQIEEAASFIAYAFLVPIFFVDVGLSTDLSSFPLSSAGLAIALLLVAVISKVVGAGYGAKWGGFTNQEALRVGVCMISRGEVGLIIATLGISSGILTTSDPLFASLFMVIILTTVLTPPLVRAAFKYTEGATA